MKGETMKHILIVIGIFLAVMALSWGETVGIIKLITLCFSWDFSLLIATGIWLAMFLVSACFKSRNSSK
jgi:hypothetical protein